MAGIVANGGAFARGTGSGERRVEPAEWMAAAQCVCDTSAMSVSETSSSVPDAVLEVLQQYWGYTSLRPLQAEAIDAGLRGQDSLVVMPTGGGKSLCYQIPPVVTRRVDVVVSPLISLMKDQVDGLRESGYAAAGLHSGVSPDERREVERGLRERRYALVFVAPERLLTPWFLETCRQMQVRSFAIDEAHCISQWGHDFRPEYRQLAVLREHFPKASLHAFTATATPRVRDDIVAQLGLRDPRVLVGIFDRPNLTYRILPQVDVHRQVIEVIRRHDKEAAIVYCLSRNDTETMAEELRDAGVNAAHYHAGLTPEQRRATQEDFATERLNVVAATVAFGMGIDRSNVRCIVHACMPKTVESYQQETGRAGRDGLEAECVLFYSAQDAIRWEELTRKSAQNAENPELLIQSQFALLRAMQRYCSSHECRHRMLSEHFGQSYDHETCGACDVCLNEVEGIEDSTVTAQKILSCVARTGNRFGMGHIVDVLLGANTERVRTCGHNTLSTYGLMKEQTKKALTALAYQLVDQGLLDRSEGDYPTVQLNDLSWEVMRGKRQVRLFRPKKAIAAKTRASVESWEGVDQGLFEHLRELRKRLAGERGVPPYVIFHDATLRDLARMRPGSLAVLRRVHGIGSRRMEEFGEMLLSAVSDYCQERGLPIDAVEVDASASASAQDVPESTRRTRSDAIAKAFDLFRSGMPLAQIATEVERSLVTVGNYLVEYIERKKPVSIEGYVDSATHQRVLDAAASDQSGRLKPIFDALGGTVPYETIKAVLAHDRVARGDAQD